ncbi:MAG: Daunorubicin/doxorubicin resistance ATP-binding protein DrrA [Phycisphaerae bacterium]|nr:Daunorubicin/doxorubicin resistance ATP-binding protein DrrA [Phycisphaerae bacterium]
MIRAENLRKRFGSLTAVDDVSIDVRAGETIGLLGPNGAGKSTTIHMLTGALRPDEGRMDIAGLGPPSERAARRRIGAAPQSLAIYEELTGAENAHFFGAIYGLSGAVLRERVRFALDFTGLTPRAGSRAKTYSGGMKRRLNLACALVHDPAVIFLDEPTVGVDPQSRNHIFENIAALKQQQRTIVYTTHYMEEAERLCDRVAIIDHGRLLATDTVENLIRRYGGKSLIEAEFEPPVPALRGVAARVEGTTVTLESDEPLHDVARFADDGARLRSLRVKQPDLEHVFLNLTGRSLRD